jgi:hypothetical protein
MLSFLKPKAAVGVIISKRKPDGDIQEQGGGDQSDGGLTAAAEDLMSAVEAKDAAGVASALRAAFTILESEASDEPQPDSDLARS